MNITTQVIVDDSNMGVAGFLIIILITYAIYMCISLYAAYIKHKNLYKAKTLIEEGHQRKIHSEEWKGHETD